MENPGASQSAASSSTAPDSAECDRLFERFLQTEQDDLAEPLLHEIISSHLGPIARKIIVRKLVFASGQSSSGSDHEQTEDVYHNVVVYLLTQMRGFRSQPREDRIDNLHSYAAVIAYNACYNFIRQKHPRRHGLKNKLRYILTRDERFAVWEGAHKDTLVGLATWRGLESTATTVDLLEKVRSEGVTFLPQHTLTAEGARTRPGELLAAIFDFVRSPIELDDLVSVVATLWDIRDEQPATTDSVVENLPDHSSTHERVEHRQLLVNLWREIGELPVRQRIALLLSLRDADGNGCIALLPLVGVATIRQIAEVLEMNAEHLVGMWKRMPLDDLTIGEQLSITRQQVINLRKSARARLARRLTSLV